MLFSICSLLGYGSQTTMRDPFSERPCLLCGGSAFLTVHRGLDHSGTVSGEFTLNQCRSCGLIKLQPFPEPEEIPGFYGEDYPNHRLASPSHQSGLGRFYQEWGLDRLCRLVVRFTGLSGGRLLDIGTGSGDFLARMRHWGTWQLFGVEVNKKVADFAREVKGLNVFPGTLLEAAFPDNSFQVITLWNVLEHLPDPRETLEVISHLLIPGGFLLISLPYLESFEARRFGRHWAGWEVPRHLFLFPWRTLIRLLVVSGFEVKGKAFPYVSFGPFSTSLQLFLSSSLSETIWRKALIRAVGSPLTHTFSLPFLYLLRYLDKSSIVVVLARKKP